MQSPARCGLCQKGPASITNQDTLLMCRDCMISPMSARGKIQSSYGNRSNAWGSSTGSPSNPVVPELLSSIDAVLASYSTSSGPTNVVETAPRSGGRQYATDRLHSSKFASGDRPTDPFAPTSVSQQAVPSQRRSRGLGESPASVVARQLLRGGSKNAKPNTPKAEPPFFCRVLGLPRGPRKKAWYEP